MINIEQERLITLSRAAKLIPGRDGGHVHVATIYRWAAGGVRDGVRLETITVGGRLFTSVEAVQRFADRLSEDPEDDAAPRPTRRQRSRKVERAEHVLERAGV